MKKLLHDNAVFLLLTLLWWGALGVLVALYSKADLHLLLNTHHTPMSDLFFKYVTEIGGSVPFIVGGVLLLFRYSHGILVLAAQLLSGIVVQVLKRLFDAPRPKLFFAEHFPDVALPFVQGVNVHSVHSFPSGHAVSVFAFFFSLAIITKHKVWQVVYFTVAMLVAYSRVYLSQHFAEDILAGSFVGVFVTLLYAYFHQQINAPCMQKKIINY